MKHPECSTIFKLPLYIVTILLSLILFGEATVTYNPSDSSAPPGVYLVSGVTKIKNGDLVVLMMPMKEVWALPGQRVTFTPDGVSVAGRGLIPNSKPEPQIPRVCPYGTYTVPPFMFLGGGARNPDSWDGRYTCFLPQSLIKGTATPLWTTH
jgi:type IV secretory pathway protease TraF